MTNERLKYSLIIGLIGAVFFISFLGGVHLFDWDEINFAEISREMLITKEYTRVFVDFLPFWEKPPLFFWLQSSAMGLFGVGEFAARFPNAICGIFTLVILFNIGKTLYNTRFGLIWAGVYFGTVLPHLYFKSGIIDPWFNLFIFCGLYYFILFHWKKNDYEGVDLKKSKWNYLFWGGFIIGLGILTKGQVAYLIAGLTMFVYWIYQRFRFYINVPEFLFFTFAATLVTLTWYGAETWKNGPWFIREFNIYQYRLFSTPDAGHKGFPGYHFAVLLFGCFPAAIFCIRSFFKMPKAETKSRADFAMWMKMLFWVVLILFSIVQSKIVHYSSMCYFPLTFLAAVSIYEIIENKISFDNWMKAGLVLTGGAFVVASIALPILGNNIDVLKPLFNDPFAVANMDAAVTWSGFEALPGVFLLAVMIASFYFIKKKTALKGFATLFLGTAIFIHLVLFTSINKIEHYSQRAAIEFFKSKVEEDCYVDTYGYKSYGHLFYTQKQPMAVKFEDKQSQRVWLMSDKVDKPVYIVTKIHRVENFLREFPNFEKIGEKNGFVFFKKLKE